MTWIDWLLICIILIPIIACAALGYLDRIPPHATVFGRWFGRLKPED